MSYEISYQRCAFTMPAAQAGHYDDLFFLVEECGSNNCWEIGNRRRARSWQCTVAGARWECLAEITRCAAACCGGSLCLYGRRGTKPETYIRAWRNAVDKAVPVEEACRLGFSLQLFTQMTDEEAANGRKYAFEQLSKQAAVTPRRGEDRISGKEYSQWRFNVTVPEQVKLWLETRVTGRGFRSVDADGPTW